MKRISIMLFLLVFCFPTVMQAQAPPPKPDPEMKKLHVWVGHWTYEEEDKPGPWGPGGKATGEYVGQMILGGSFFQGQYKDKGGQALEVCGYDPVNKEFDQDLYWSDGTRLSGVLTVSGNTWTWTGKRVVGGKQYLAKSQMIFAPDLMSATERGKISSDGKTWTPFYEGKYTKVQPAPKK